MQARKLVSILFLATTVTADACPTGPALTAGTQHCSSNQTGTFGSFGWSIWSSGSGGCITPYGNTAAFKATWNNSGDFLAREGFQWNETKTYDQYGTVTADYAYTKSGTAGGYSFIGIYGWSNNPLIEYYIVDDWFGSGSAPTGGGTLKGTFTADSGTYKVYTHQQVNQPSIHGTTTFMQYYFGTNPSNNLMYLYVPTNVAAEPPILVAMHYCTGTANAFYTGSQFAAQADLYGFIVIYPDANRTGQCWDVQNRNGDSCDYPGTEKSIAAI